MSGNKRRFSEVDDSDDDGQPQDTDSDQTGPGSSTNDQQDMEPTVAGSAFAQLGTSNGASSGGNDTASGPGDYSGNPRGMMDPASMTNNNSLEAQTTTDSSTKKRKRRRKGEPEPDHTATIVEKAQRMKRVPQACDRCHVSYFLPYGPKAPIPATDILIGTQV